MGKIMRRAIFLLCLVGAFSACDYKSNPIENLAPGQMTSPITAAEVTWEESIKTIFETKCFGCHANGATKFNDYESVKNIFSDKIMPAIESGRMPMGGNKLSDKTIKLLKAWEKGGFAQAVSAPAPSDPVDNPTDPSNPGDNPTDPSNPGDNPTDPSNPGDNPTDPTNPGDNPTDPVPAFNAAEVIDTQCAGCHASGMKNVPNIYSLPVDYLVTEMGHYRTGLRQDQVMFTMNSALSSFSEEQIALLAEELNSRDKCSVSISRDDSNVDAELMRRGAQLFKFKCASCHAGAGTFAFPWLKGQDRSYLFKTMQAFVTEVDGRPSTQMKAYLRGLKKRDLKALALFLSQEQDCN